MFISWDKTCSAVATLNPPRIYEGGLYIRETVDYIIGRDLSLWGGGILNGI